MMSCWNLTELPSWSLPSQSTSQLTEGFFEPCETHGNEIIFICKQLECRDENNCMLCKDCLVDHKSHDWITKQEFLTPNIRKILMFKQTETDMILQATLKRLVEHIITMEQSIRKQFTLIKHHLQKSVTTIEEKYRFRVEGAMGSGHVILNKMKLEKLLSIFQIEQSKFQWIRVMQENMMKIGDKIGQSIKFLLQDLLNISNAEKWEERERHVDEFRQFQKHLHQHLQSDDRYYRFSNVDKHMNIKLNREMDEAIYYRSVPSKPLVVASQYISQVHNKFGYEIMKMNSKAIFFDSTTVFLGVCSANIVKSFGYRKVNEYGKGSYMISSQGWAHHSTNEEYNNKQIVGWGFGQGDTISVQIIFNTECVIRFTKKSRFFNNVFEMPLKLNQFQMNLLKPCLGFDSEEGAIVRIFDINDEVAQTQSEERVYSSNYDDSMMYF